MCRTRSTAWRASWQATRHASSEGCACSSVSCWRSLPTSAERVRGLSRWNPSTPFCRFEREVRTACQLHLSQNRELPGTKPDAAETRVHHRTWCPVPRPVPRRPVGQQVDEGTVSCCAQEVRSPKSHSLRYFRPQACAPGRRSPSATRAGSPYWDADLIGGLGRIGMPTPPRRLITAAQGDPAGPRIYALDLMTRDRSRGAPPLLLCSRGRTGGSAGACVEGRDSDAVRNVLRSATFNAGRAS